ncbi:23S rRNA (uracil-C(5))-methyltransferase RlmCD [Chlamydiales bacterium STE3]|nr:23S rRNA (uracil-C(5))-methyltransferase RlmCD [Chlamydiales bacterium STE3]
MHSLKKHDVLQTTISKLGKQGEGVGDFQGFPIYVEGALPGELVEVTISECRTTYARANLITALQVSPLRVTPPCPYFGHCGGCQLMHLSYEEQLVFKQQKVLSAFLHVANMHLTILPCLPSPKALHYRNKTQYPVEMSPNGLILGLYTRSSHDLIAIDACQIHCELGESVYHRVQKILQQSSLKAYNPQTREGELRYLLIRTSINLREVLVTLVTTSQLKVALLPLAEKIMAENPSVKGIVQNINDQATNVILGSSYQTILGSPSTLEKLGDLFFKISSASFFQVNTLQAECLYNKALSLSAVKGHETLLDAYCGVGSIALFFARHVKKVIGVERVPEAIEDAKANAALNCIDNTEFICASAETFIPTLDAIDILILNPPRKGCDKSLLEQIPRFKPRMILYISCDPTTLARDVAFLCMQDYVIETIQPFDMFPQTTHVETLVKLTLNQT